MDKKQLHQLKFMAATGNQDLIISLSSDSIGEALDVLQTELKDRPQFEIDFEQFNNIQSLLKHFNKPNNDYWSSGIISIFTDFESYENPVVFLKNFQLTGRLGERFFEIARIIIQTQKNVKYIFLLDDDKARVKIFLDPKKPFFQHNAYTLIEGYKMDETEYLESSEKNKKHLEESISQYQNTWDSFFLNPETSVSDDFLNERAEQTPVITLHNEKA